MQVDSANISVPNHAGTQRTGIPAKAIFLKEDTFILGTSPHSGSASELQYRGRSVIEFELTHSNKTLYIKLMDHTELMIKLK